MSIEGTANTEYASLSGKIRTFVVDKTLTISGACADAKATGDAIAKVDARVDEGSIAKRVQDEVGKQAVKKTGDTMTGDLLIEKGNNPALLLSDTSTVTDGFARIDTESGAFQVGTGNVMNGSFEGMYITLDAVAGSASLHDESGDHILLHSGNKSLCDVPTLVRGSYVGTGEVGIDHPNSLSFPFTPAFIAVVVENTKATEDGQFPCLFVRPWKYNTYHSNNNTDGGTINNYVTWGTRNVSWYAKANDTDSFDPDDSSPSMQLNTQGVTYHYIAIG